MYFFEDEENDRLERENAELAFDHISKWLHQNQSNLQNILKPHTELFQPINAEPGSLCLIIPNVKLLVVFEPFRDSRGQLVDGASGPGKGGWIGIYLPALKAPNNTDNLANRFVSLRNIFIHEYMHFLLIRREQPSRERSRIKKQKSLGPAASSYAKKEYEDGGSNAAVDRGDWGGYVNHPQETNAYYQEAISNIVLAIKNLSTFDKRRLNNYSTQQLVSWLKKYFDNRFIRYLNKENTRKLDKRLARFVEQSLRTILKS